MGDGTGYYGTPQLASQLGGRVTTEVQGSSGSDTAAAVVMITSSSATQRSTTLNQTRQECWGRPLGGLEIFSRFAFFFVNISGIDPMPDHSLSPQ